jgi:hypothetical protein
MAQYVFDDKRHELVEIWDRIPRHDHLNSLEDMPGGFHLSGY